LHKARVTIKDLVRVDDRCKVVEGGRPASSEMLVHLAIYRALPQAMAVVHAHPPAATGFAQACRAIDTRSSSEASVILGPQVPLIGYERPSTPQLANAVGKAMHPRQKAYLLAQHGAITWGSDLWDAYDTLDTLEVFTQSLVVATIVGGARPLPAKERAWLERKFIAPGSGS
jgi:L-fuculose-phosphate aldolase